MSIRTTQLENKITVITEHMPALRSVAIGFWVAVGSVHEQPQQAGLAHFMEHMLFKGTHTRSAFDISVECDCLGVELNAFTAKEHTCYHTNVLSANLPACFEIMADMFAHPAFDPAQIELEREVVLEEIASCLDTPDDYVYELFCDALFGPHPLGRPVLGDSDLVSSYTKQDLQRFHEEHYVGQNLTIVVCGDVDHGQVVELAQRLLGDVRPGGRRKTLAPAAVESRRLAAIKRPGEQAHIVMGTTCVGDADPCRFAYAIADFALGGTMSSRLFTEIREKRGLAYSVYTSSQLYHGIGQFEVCVSTRPENIVQVVQVARAELARAASDGFTVQEFERVREMVCGSYVLSMESAHNHMMRLGKMAASGLELTCVDATCDAYRSCTLKEVNKAAAALLSRELTVAVIGPYDKEDIERMVG